VDREQNELYRFRTGYLKFKAALCDRNTGLLAYPLLIDEIRRYFEDRERVAVLVLQIVELERMESIYGWQACDRLLGQAAEAVRAATEKRLGGDTLVTQDGVHQGRFVVFHPESDEKGNLTALTALRAADELKEEVQAVFAGPEFAGVSPAIQFAAGASLLTENPFIRFQRQVRSAIDGALLPFREADWAGRADLEQEVRKIIRNGSLEVLYQPIVTLARREVVGYEALVRGPEGTPLAAPSLLFSYGDQFGLGRELDRACRRRALEAADTLEAGSLLFLNSVPEMVADDPEADGELSEVMTRTGRAPEQFVLEVSERRLQTVGETERRGLDQLRSLGIRLALDNAGSGFATLQLIADLQPDFVKIDPTLVRGLDSNLVQQEVARSVVAAAEEVKSEVVAPGVESEPEAEAAQRCGVRLAQGFHLARPRPGLTGPVRPRPSSRGSKTV
jgi:EAL domain-containing protein (putative c-di-GMP-specific phosphodiesterase class I)